MASNNKASISEYKCAICLQLLVEPVVLPCKHEMCRSCFCQNVEEGNFLCPICRKRISTWARKCIREGTLVDQNRWNLIQKLFPHRCSKRLQGNDDESDDESGQPPPKRVLAKSGELRKEYEQEMNKVLQLEKEEEQASYNLINNLIKEEKALLQQQKEDEQLAKSLSEKFKNTEENNEDISNLTRNSDVTSKTKSKDLKRKAKNSKQQGRSYTLERYFSNNNCPGNLSPSDPQHNSDFEFAMALQKKFDEEAVVVSKREDYMLRKTTGNYEHRETQNSHESKSYKQKNGHTCTQRAQLGKDLLYVNVKNPLIDEEKIKISDQLSKEPRMLCDRKKFNDTVKLGKRKK